MKEKIWLSSPHMGGDELAFVEKAFSENWIAPLGPNLDGFENDLSSYLGENTRVAGLSSGTSAIHLALIILGVKSGDEVICQSMTFSASANPIVYTGAQPVFVGSERTTWNMSPEFLEDAIRRRLEKGKKPKAIIVVHLYGMPARMGEISAIAKKYSIPLLEDAAEALGSSIDGQKCGTFGDMAILSFNGNKIITTSGGGALVSKNAAWVERAKFLATQARDPAPHYQHSQVGYNYRLSNVCAGIGRGQMRVLDNRVHQRRANFEYYKRSLAHYESLLFQSEPDGFFSNRWLTTILVRSQDLRNQIATALHEQNIESRPLWKPMHLQPVFSSAPYYGDQYSEHLFDNGLCLPSGSNLTESQLDEIVSVINKTLTKSERTLSLIDQIPKT